MSSVPILGGSSLPEHGPMLEADGLGRVYESPGGPVRALDGMALALRRGCFAAVMGPSGCGKSTFLNLVAGLDRPTSGVLRVDSVEPARLSERALTDYRRRTVGVVFQFFNLLPTLTVRENIALPAMLAGSLEWEALERAADLARLVGLERRLSHRAHQLSGGEMQRAAIARAMVNRPPLLLADEPTGNLDTHTAAQVLDLLASLPGEQGATVLMVTHSPEAAARADVVVRMVDGRVEETFAPVAAG